MAFLWVGHINALSRTIFSLRSLIYTLGRYVGSDFHGLYTSGSDTRPLQAALGTSATEASAEPSMPTCFRSAVFCCFYHYTTTGGAFGTIFMKNRGGYQDFDLHQPETGHF